MFGGPCSGKSTSAALVFAHMKLAGLKVELVTEYAKDLTYSGHFKTLGDQINVFANQHTRLNRLVGHVDYIVTDAPLLNSLIYGEEQSRHFRELVFEKFNEYDNVNFFINRVKPYAQFGRTQSETESDILSTQIKAMLNEYNQTFVELDGNDKVYIPVLELIKEN
jgi:hypothetical protein